jgi:hypothetical protein
MRHWQRQKFCLHGLYERHREKNTGGTGVDAASITVTLHDRWAGPSTPYRTAPEFALGWPAFSAIFDGTMWRRQA